MESKAEGKGGRSVGGAALRGAARPCEGAAGGAPVPEHESDPRAGSFAGGREARQCSEMPPALLADLVLAVHALFVAFVALGGLLALRWRPVAWVHVPCALWGAWISVTGGICPLTPLENRLRRQAGQAGYEGSFLEQYVVPVLYPAGLTREIQVGLGLAVLVLNGVVYWRRWRRGREAGAGAASGS